MTGTQVPAAWTIPWWTREKPVISQCRVGPWSPSSGHPFPSSISFPGSDRWAERAREAALGFGFYVWERMCRQGVVMPVAAAFLPPSQGGRQRWEPPREVVGAISSPLAGGQWLHLEYKTKPLSPQPKARRPHSYCEGMELVNLERSWTAWRPRAKHRRQGSAFKTNHILFPRNKLSEGISNTLTIQSTQVWCQFHSRQSPERLSANVFTTVSDQTSEASFGLGQRIS